MIREINFLRDRRKQLTKAQAQDKIFLKYSLIGLGVVGAVALIITGVRVWFLQQQNSLVADQEQLKATILSQESIERRYVLLAGKVAAIQQIFKLRQDKQAAISFFYDRLGADIVLERIEYDPGLKTDPLLKITISAPEVFTFERVQEVINSQAVKNQYPNITAGNITRSGDASYTIEISVPLI